MVLKTNCKTFNVVSDRFADHDCFYNPRLQSQQSR